MKPDIVDTAEIAWRFDVDAGTVHRWRQRHKGFPRPDYELIVGPVWLWKSVAKWGAQTGRKTRWEKARNEH